MGEENANYTIRSFTDFNVSNFNNIYTIELSRFSISNNNTNATATTKGINDAIQYARDNGYNGAKLPVGQYLIDCEYGEKVQITDPDTGATAYTVMTYGILLKDNFKLILTDAVLNMKPCEDPCHSMITIRGENIELEGGTLIGDKYTHDYGMILTAEDFELGSINSATGAAIESDSEIRSRFISTYVNSSTNIQEALPEEFTMTPVYNTRDNSVYGVAYIYCYNSNGTYLGKCEVISMCDKKTLLANTSKIRIVLPNEITADDQDFSKMKYALTKRTSQNTFEFGTGICLNQCNNVYIHDTTVCDFTGDCIGTMANYYDTRVDNIKIIGCDLSGSRRQGISLVSGGRNYLIQNCRIHNINGIDPQFGIDIEHYTEVRDVLVDNCDFYNNRKGDIDNFNGTSGIEIQNSRFNGGVCSIYGKGLKIHDCTFEYIPGVNDSEKLNKTDCTLNLSTDNNISYNNVLNNAFYYMANASSISYGNTINGGKAYMVSQIKEDEAPDKFINCNVFIEPYEGMRISNAHFENCEIREPYKKYNMEMNNVVFKDSEYYAYNKVVFNDCNIDMKTKSFLNGYQMEDGSGSFGKFNNCTFKTSYENEILLFGTQLNMTFNNCNFDLARYRMAYNRDCKSTFNSCNVNFNDLNTSASSVEIDSIFSEWDFVNCKFKSTYPALFKTAVATNPVILGNVIFDHVVNDPSIGGNPDIDTPGSGGSDPGTGGDTPGTGGDNPDPDPGTGGDNPDIDNPDVDNPDVDNPGSGGNPGGGNNEQELNRLKYIDNRKIDAENVNLKDANNNFNSEILEGAMNEVGSKMKAMEIKVNNIREKKLTIKVNGGTYTESDNIITLPNYPTSVPGGSGAITGGGTVTDEQIQNAINDYLARNPINTSPSQSRWQGKTWLLVGDSISTEGKEYAKTGYGTVVAGNLGLIKTNIAVSGRTLKDAYDWLNSTTIEYDLITVMMGTNDVPFLGSLGNVKSTGNTTISGRVQMIIDLVRSKFPNSILAFFTPINRTDMPGTYAPTNNEDGYYLGVNNITYDQVDKVIRDKCAINNIPCLSLVNAIDPRTPALRQKYFMSVNDGTHPNELGHAKFIAPLVNDFLEKIAPFSDVKTTTPTVYYTIARNLSNASISNTISSIAKDSSYSSVITANNGFAINSVTVSMGGINITNSVYSAGTINIARVTGNVVITVTTRAVTGGTMYTVTNNLSNCVNSNATTSVAQNTSYTAVLNANSGYILGAPIITMGGVDISNTAYNNGTISIPIITGDVVITCSAIQSSGGNADPVTGTLIHSYNIPSSGADLTNHFNLTKNASWFNSERNDALKLGRGDSFVLEFDFTRKDAYCNFDIVNTGTGAIPHNQSSAAPTRLGRIFIGTDFCYPAEGGLFYVKGFTSEDDTTRIDKLTTTKTIKVNQKYNFRMTYDSSSKVSNYYIDGTNIGSISGFEIIVDGLNTDIEYSIVENLRLYKV